MKGLLALCLLSVFIACAYSAPTDQEEQSKPQCGNFCTLELAPVCGYDGTCYRSYGNKCAYDADKCNGKSSLETVDMSLCTLAEKDTHPNYKLC